MPAYVSRLPEQASSGRPVVQTSCRAGNPEHRSPRLDTRRRVLSMLRFGVVVSAGVSLLCGLRHEQRQDRLPGLREGPSLDSCSGHLTVTQTGSQEGGP
jgi:hypothetical protein